MTKFTTTERCPVLAREITRKGDRFELGSRIYELRRVSTLDRPGLVVLEVYNETLDFDVALQIPVAETVHLITQTVKEV